jgi:hypothetical protein
MNEPKLTDRAKRVWLDSESDKWYRVNMVTTGVSETATRTTRTKSTRITLRFPCSMMYTLPAGEVVYVRDE